MNYPDTDIKAIQKLLHLQETGIYDELTEAAVRNYQIKHNLSPTGDLDEDTHTALLGDHNLSSDLSEQYNASIHKYTLPSKEYLAGPTKKEYIFLHHTAGWNNPYAVVDNWARDTRGAIGTQYVIGGINPKTNDDTHDGVIVECFGDANYAWHLGTGNTYVHTHSVGIELCNFGWLTKKGNDFYTYTNTRVDPKNVVTLKESFRGYTHWVRYTDEQLNSLNHLIHLIAGKHNISVEIGLKQRLKVMSPYKALEYYNDAVNGKVKGVLSHTSVRRDKFDVFPQDELIDLINSL